MEPGIATGTAAWGRSTSGVGEAVAGKDDVADRAGLFEGHSVGWAARELAWTDKARGVGVADEKRGDVEVELASQGRSIEVTGVVGGIVSTGNEATNIQWRSGEGRRLMALDRWRRNSPKLVAPSTPSVTSAAGPRCQGDEGVYITGDVSGIRLRRRS